MQAKSSTDPSDIENRSYPLGMARKLSRPRPHQGARLTSLRRDAGITQVELARLLGEPQTNIAYWEQSEKPPRSDVLPKMAQILGVSVEQILGATPITSRRPGPVGRAQKIFDDLSTLPRSQQDKILDIISAYLAQHMRKAG
jgi:transcriptional regulator with XRE-family HTH domain